MKRRTQLSQRRNLLVAECALQRSILAAQGRELGESAGLIRTDDGLIGRLSNLPGWASVLLAVGAVLMPGRLARLARSGLMVWQLWQNLKAATGTAEKPERS